MVQHQSSTLDATFGALSDPTRRAILARLGDRDHAVSELAGPFAMSLTAVAKHLRILEGAGLVRREKRGRVVTCRLNAARLRDAAAWLAHYERFWSVSLDRLAAYAEGKEAEARESGQ
jgi:DNA-binding transcriptional ArsR family regulator